MAPSHVPARLWSVAIHDGFRDDLRALQQVDRLAAADVVALVQAIREDRDLLPRLTKSGDVSVGEVPFNIVRFGELWETNRRVWRIKILEKNAPSRAFRLLYVFHPQELRYYFLAIAPRGFNYDPKHPISVRVCDIYDRLGIT